MTLIEAFMPTFELAVMFSDNERSLTGTHADTLGVALPKAR